MSASLLLDEHYSATIAAALRQHGHDVAVVDDPDLHGATDEAVFRWAAETGRRVVTENIEDFRPLLLRASASGRPVAPLLLVSPRRFPPGGGDRTAAITMALHSWLSRTDVLQRPVEDWLV